MDRNQILIKKIQGNLMRKLILMKSKKDLKEAKATEGLI